MQLKHVKWLNLKKPNKQNLKDKIREDIKLSSLKKRKINKKTVSKEFKSLTEGVEKKESQGQRAEKYHPNINQGWWINMVWNNLQKPFKVVSA